MIALYIDNNVNISNALLHTLIWALFERDRSYFLIKSFVYSYYETKSFRENIIQRKIMTKQWMESSLVKEAGSATLYHLDR